MFIAYSRHYNVTKYLTFLVIVSAIPLILVIAGNISANYIDTFGQKSNEQTKILSLHNLIQNGSPFLGNASALITVLDFSDFQ